MAKMTHKISEHVSYKEVVNSRKAKELGIENKPTEEQLERIITLQNEVFEPMRKRLGGRAIHISSCFRSALLNEAVGGDANSDHLCNHGAAEDLDNDPFPHRPQNDELFWDLYRNANFDQLIWEAGTKKKPGWVHVSYRSKETNRREVLRYIPGQGYIKFDLV